MTESETPIADITARRHRWNVHDTQRIPACESPDGNDRTEKKCEHCSLIKITVHPPHGQPFRLWRTREGKIWQGDATPPCIPASASEAAA